MLRSGIDDRGRVRAGDINRGELALRQNLGERIVQVAIEDIDLLTKLLVDAHDGIGIVKNVLEVGVNSVRVRIMRKVEGHIRNRHVGKHVFHICLRRG